MEEGRRPVNGRAMLVAMKTALTAAWLLLALVHLPPALVAFRPVLTERFYGVPSNGTISLLLTHRGALFLVVAWLASFAAFVPDARRVASVGVAISVLSFLVLYARAGMPTGPLRNIAAADAVALVPLCLVIYAAWRPPIA